MPLTVTVTDYEQFSRRQNAARRAYNKVSVLDDNRILSSEKYAGQRSLRKEDVVTPVNAESQQQTWMGEGWRGTPANMRGGVRASSRHGRERGDERLQRGVMR